MQYEYNRMLVININHHHVRKLTYLLSSSQHDRARVDRNIAYGWFHLCIYVYCVATLVPLIIQDSSKNGH